MSALATLADEPPTAPRKPAFADIAGALVLMGEDRARTILSRLEPEAFEPIMGALRAGKARVARDGHWLAETFAADFDRAPVGAGADTFDDWLTPPPPPETEREESDGAEVEADAQTGAAPDVAAVVQFIENENPTLAAAAILAMDEPLAASVMEALDDEMRRRIGAHWFHLRSDERTTERVRRWLDRSLAADGDGAGEAARADRVAALLNALPAEANESLEPVVSREAGERRWSKVRANLFRFDDLARLDVPARTLLVEELDGALLNTALAASGPAVREAVLSLMGARARRMVESELEALTPTPAQASEARNALTRRVLDLAREGRITLPQR